MAKSKITIETLAKMISIGFDNVENKMATKIEMNKRFDMVDKRFDEMDKRFDKVENLILIDHKRRLEKLELDMRELKSLIGMK
jgi:hypothetical protein